MSALTVLDLSLQNPIFVKLAVLRGDTSKRIPCAAMPPSILLGIKSIYNVLRPGTELPESVLSVSFREGRASRLWHPSIGKNPEGQLIINFGGDAIILDSQSIKEYSKKADLEISTERVGGYDEICMNILATEGDQSYLMSLPLRKSRELEYALDVKQIKLLFKNGKYEEIAALCTDISGSGSSSATKDLRCCIEGDRYTILAAEPKNTKYGENYILQIKDKDGKVDEYWSHKKLNIHFAAGLILPAEMEITFGVYKNKPCVDGIDVFGEYTPSSADEFDIAAMYS